MNKEKLHKLLVILEALESLGDEEYLLTAQNLHDIVTILQDVERTNQNG